MIYYGRKLLEVGQKAMDRPGGVLDVLCSKAGQTYFRFNTQSNRPINQLKMHGIGSPPKGMTSQTRCRNEDHAKIENN